MLTIIESPLFSRLWPDYWTEDEHGEFVTYISANADGGDLIVGSVAAGRFDGLGQAWASAAA